MNVESRTSVMTDPSDVIEFSVAKDQEIKDIKRRGNCNNCGQNCNHCSGNCYNCSSCSNCTGGNCRR